MNYNDGHIHDGFYNESESILDKIADDFSEGCIELKNCLLTLWHNNIKTRACCAGHEDSETPKSYIMILIDKESAYFVNNIIKIFFMYYYGKSEEKVELELRQYKGIFTLNLKLFSLENKSIFFDLIRLSSMKKDYNVDSNFYCMSILSEYAKKYDKSISYYYIKNGGLLYFGYSVCSEFLSLKSELKIMEETGIFPFGAYYCDEDDLRNLAAICYRDVVYGSDQNIKK